MCLLEESHIYMWILQLFIELIALPPTAIPIKSYDFDGPVNSAGHSASLGLVQFL
jgi:hypothetical protein